VVFLLNNLRVKSLLAYTLAKKYSRMILLNSEKQYIYMYRGKRRRMAGRRMKRMSAGGGGRRERRRRRSLWV
jgi:hypothetical protein